MGLHAAASGSTVERLPRCTAAMVNIKDDRSPENEYDFSLFPWGLTDNYALRASTWWFGNAWDCRAADKPHSEALSEPSTEASTEVAAQRGAQ